MAEAQGKVNGSRGLKIDYNENVVFFEVELADFDVDSLSASERKELEVANNNFIATQLTPLLLNKINPCECRIGEVQQKHMRRAQLSGNPNTYIPYPDQDDVDAYRYGVIVLAENGKLTAVSTIIRQCKRCMKIDYWGDVVIFSRMVAEVTTNFFSAQARMAAAEAAQDQADAEALKDEVAETPSEENFGEVTTPEGEPEVEVRPGDLNDPPEEIKQE